MISQKLEAYKQFKRKKNYKNDFTSNEIPTENETNSKINLMNLEPFIIDKHAPQ